MDLQNRLTNNLVIKNILSQILSLVLVLIIYFILLAPVNARVTSDELENFVTEVSYLNKESIEYAKGSENYNIEKEQVNTNNKIVYLDAESLKYEENLKESSEVKPSKAKSKQSESTDESLLETIPATVDAPVETKKIEDTADNEVTLTGEDQEESDEDPLKYTRLDPLINYNREMYYFNKEVDRYLIKPPAKVYSYIIPSPVKHMVTNFYSNIQDINVLINDFLQSEVDNSVATIYRLVLNSTFGIFGLIDVAQSAGFPKRANDFGVTFGKWFEPESVYFIIPILGPSTIRDNIGTAIGAGISLGFYLPNDYVWPFTGVYILDKRANLLTTEKIIDTIADEEYEFVRNAYLDYRSRLISGETLATKDEHQEQKLLDDIVTSDDVLSDKKSDNLDELKELDELENLE